MSLAGVRHVARGEARFWAAAVREGGLDLAWEAFISPAHHPRQPLRSALPRLPARSHNLGLIAM